MVLLSSSSAWKFKLATSLRWGWSGCSEDGREVSEASSVKEISLNCFDYFDCLVSSETS